MSVTLLQGDCREVLKTLPEQSVQCVVTSPPYWGLRDYGTGQWDGGSAECDHVQRRVTHREGLAKLGEQYRGGGHAQPEPIAYRSECGKCGAQRIDQQIGLEETPDQYVASMVAVFREVRRVLRNDGVLWLNLGDTYAGSWGAMSYAKGDIAARRFGGDGEKIARPVTSRLSGDLKAKDLVGIPWMVAFALRADGWYLRSDIIWSKPNPMPESVTDRPTKAHEYLFLLSKSERYFYDADAIKELAVNGDASAPRDPRGALNGPNAGRRTPTRGAGYGAARGSVAGRTPDRDGGFDAPLGYRNRRSVWTVSTTPYRGAHFATFPEKLIEPCILAGSNPGDTVLDPFVGSGTTARVCERLQRSCIGIDLSYQDLQEKRTNGVQVELFV